MPEFWDRIGFKLIDARQYAALRIGFGALSAVYFMELLPFLATQYSGSGWLGETRQIPEQNGGRWSLFFITDGRRYANLLAYTILMVGIVSALLLMAGWKSRVNAGITWLVWVSLWNRNPLLLDGDDAVLKLMCFYLMLSPCGNCWSVDARSGKKLQRVAVWPLRLIQFQIALIYFVSGWVKFQSPEWLNGTIMQYILVHPHYSRWDGWEIINTTFITAFLATIAAFIRWWELLFPFLLLNTYTRNVSLIIGILFHTGLLLTMNLRWFPIVMLSLYPALVSNDLFIRIEHKLLNYFRIER